MGKKVKRNWQRAPIVVPVSGTAYVPAGLTPAERRLLRQTEFNAMVQKINGLDWQGGKNKLLHSIGAWALYRLTLSDDPPDFSQPIRNWHEDARLAWERARRVASIVDLMGHDVNAAVGATLALGMDVAEAELSGALKHAAKMTGRKPGAKGPIARIAEWIASETGNYDLATAARFLGGLELETPYRLPCGADFELLDLEQDGPIRLRRFFYYLKGSEGHATLDALRKKLSELKKNQPNPGR